MTVRILAVALAGAALIVVLVLLRRRRIREKYTSIWLLVVTVVFVLAVFPGLAYWLAGVVGVVLPANLLFLVAVGVLFVIALQLSVEIGDLEAETRALAEELALTRRQLEVLEERLAAPDPGVAPGPQVWACPREPGCQLGSVPGNRSM